MKCEKCNFLQAIAFYKTKQVCRKCYYKLKFKDSKQKVRSDNIIINKQEDNKQS